MLSDKSYLRDVGKGSLWIYWVVADIGRFYRACVAYDDDDDNLFLFWKMFWAKIYNIYFITLKLYNMHGIYMHI